MEFLLGEPLLGEISLSLRYMEGDGVLFRDVEELEAALYMEARGCPLVSLSEHTFPILIWHYSHFEEATPFPLSFCRRHSGSSLRELMSRRSARRLESKSYRIAQTGHALSAERSLLRLGTGVLFHMIMSGQEALESESSALASQLAREQD